MKANVEKLNQLADNQSTWIEKAQERRKNAPWLGHSRNIAVKVLSTLRSKKMNQVELAAEMGVSPQQINKIVKGKENLTLETIAKLEMHLGISLIKVPEQPHFNIQPYKQYKKAIFTSVYINTNISATKGSYQRQIGSYTQYDVHEKNLHYGN